MTARDAFFTRICERVKTERDIVIVSSDLGAPSLDDFRKDFPERYISVGIAEQNLVSVSAGLALTGRKVVAYGLNPFPITRAFDQIRNLLAELKIPLTLCALNAGLCSAESGYTHMPIEDMAMMRTLANIQTVNPSDETIAAMLADDVGTADKARYIRFDKAVKGELYQRREIDFDRGFSAWGDPGGLCVVSCGSYIRPLREIAEPLRTRGLNVRVVDLYVLPADEEQLVRTLAESRSILTVEENVLAGGIGSYILEVLSDAGLGLPVKRMGLAFPKGYYDVFTNRAYIRSRQHIDEESVGRAMRALLDAGERA